MTTEPAAPPARRPSRRAVRIAGMVATGALVATVGVLAGAKIWVEVASAGQVYASADAPSRPVTLVLGAGLNPDGTPTPFLAARLDRAIELYESGRTQVLLVSGDNRRVGYDEPSAMADYLRAHGIPEGRIVRDFAGWDSYDSCARAQRIFGVTSLIVVGQSYHVGRALAICRALGLDAVAVGDDTVSVYRQAWLAGQLREWPANVKAVIDVVTRRDPVLGPTEDSVARALETTG